MNSTTTRRSWWRPNAPLPLTMMILLGLAACGTETIMPTCSTDPSLCPAGPDTTAAYINNLPSWQSFAAPDTTLTNGVVAEADTLPLVETIVDSVPQFDDTGEIDPLTNVRYVCQERPFTVSDAPEKIVMFSPNRSILYAGALVQGRSKKELGSLLPLSVAQRAEMEIVISDLPTGSNSRTVVPTSGTVENARGEMIGNAILDGLGTPSSSTFELETYHSERSFAISANLSGRYLGFEASASGSVERDLTETTVTAHFFEKMYTVSVERPATGFFSDAFTNEVLQGYITQGVIGPDNLPVYVSEVVYGRMMMFSVTSTEEESEIRAAMQASYETFTGGVSGGIDSKSSAILARSKIVITAIGGSGDAAAAMIRSGDWSAYFASSAGIDTAVPLSYTFSNVGDGSIAAVTEATDYTINECTPKPIIPGTFDFNDRQELVTGVTPGYETHFGDVNGDSFADMIFSYRSGTTGEIAVALGSAAGTYTMQAKEDATYTPTGGWSIYDNVVVGDFDDDGMDDIAWNQVDPENRVVVATSDGDGSFTWLPEQSRGGTTWAPFTLHSADIDNANGDDLVWLTYGGSLNRTYVALSNGDGTFDMTAGPQDQVGTSNWGFTDFFIADVTGDANLDLVHSRTIESGNATWVSIGNGDGTFDMTDGAFTVYGGNGWADYKPLIGDMNGDQRADLVFVADGRTNIPVHRMLGSATGTFATQGWHPLPAPAKAAGPYEMNLGDVDGDGDADLILVDLNSANNPESPTNRLQIWIGLGTVDEFGTRFDFTPVDQLHPASDIWAQYDVDFVDVNGDNKRDVVIHWNSSPHQVYVVLAK